jgi:pimeloyl-ACP methyl ester carboxylesterase
MRAVSRTQTLDLGDVRLAYTEAGTGEPAVLLLHGMACERSQLDHQLRHLAPRHRCVSLDLRGHGESDKPEGSYSTQVFVGDLVRVIEQLDLGRPIVIGHSRGGSLALALATARPGLVRTLVLLDSGIRRPDGRRADLEPFYASLGGPDHAERVREFVARRLLEPTDGAQVIAQVEAVMGETPAHVFRAMGEGVLEFDSLTAAQAYQLPGLLVLAGRPSFLDAEALSTLPDNWHVARVVGAGHFVQMVVPDQVNAMIDRFLELAGVYASPTEAELTGHRT